MAVTTLRAAQTSYPTTFDGGTSDQFSGNGLGIGPFMDAIERQDTKILNSMKKGKAGNQRKERTGMHGVTPRGSKGGSAVLASDSPLAPVSRGRMFHNFYQEFSKHLTISNQADQEPSIEFPQGGLLAKDMVKLGKELKMDLEQAFINGRRQEGTPDPSNPIPAMTGGLIQFAELSGNVFNVGGAAVLLSIDVINEALITLDESIGDNRGAKMLMSHRTKQIFNRLKYPSDYNRGPDGTNVDLRWNTVETAFGRLAFESEYGIPDGLIILFDPSEMEYAPFVGEDWHEKDVPTKGNYTWRAVSGTYTFRPGAVPGYALINN